MVVAHAATGRSLAVDRYFPALHERLTADPAYAGRVAPVLQDGRCVGFDTPEGQYGLDNGYNLLETSTRPVRRSEGGLQALAQLVEGGLAHVLSALQADDAMVLNASSTLTAGAAWTGTGRCACRAPFIANWWSTAAGSTGKASTLRPRTAPMCRCRWLTPCGH